MKDLIKTESLGALGEEPVDGGSARKRLLRTLRDKKFLILFAIAYLVPLYLVYLIMFMKIIFMPIINDDAYLAMCSITLTIAGMLGAPFWGTLADRLGFKKTLLLVCLTDFVTKCLGLACTAKWNIVVMYFLIGFNDRGIITIIGPGLIEIFGLEMATELIPYKGFSMIMAYLTVPLFQMLLSHFVSYQGILLFFIVFTILALYLSYYFYKKVHYIPRTAKTLAEPTDLSPSK
jgi:MFS family permease